MGKREMQTIHDSKRPAPMGFSEGIRYAPSARIMTLIDAIATGPNPRAHQLFAPAVRNQNWTVLVAAALGAAAAC